MADTDGVFDFTPPDRELEYLSQEELVSLARNLIAQNRVLNRDLYHLKIYLNRVKSLGKSMKAVKQVQAAERFKMEKYMKLQLEHSRNVILFLDVHDRIVYCTNILLKVIRVKDFEEINGRSAADICAYFGDKHLIERQMEALQTIRTTRTALALDDQVYVIHENGERERRFLNVIFTPLLGDNGEYGGAIVLCHDITDMQARILAEDANAAKDQFIASVSHELRTPLNAVLGLTELELRKDLPGETIVNLEKIYAAGQSLLALINEVLDVSKIGAGQFTLDEDEYDFTEMISEALSINVVRLTSRPVAFAVDVDERIPSRLCGDETRVKQILNNLLTNAFKFTEEGEVRLSTTCELRGDNAWLTFTVSDTGIGIREEHLGKLFKNYSQLDSRTSRKIEGTGLGLSICRSLAEMMSGSVSVESEFGKGSRFTVRLLQKVVDRRPIGADVVEDLKKFRLLKNLRGELSAPQVTMPNGRVLVVDDVLTNQDVAKGLLTRYGLTVHCVSSGRQAVELVREGEKKYDIIFMDHMMPEMDGLEAVEIIRQRIGTDYARKVPIVMLTANAISGRREMFLQHGADDFLAKPVNMFQLETILKTWMPRGKQVEAAPDSDGSREADWDENFSIPGLNVRQGLVNTGGSMQQYRDTLSIFCRDADEKAAQVRESVETGDLALYTVLVHGLKGASRSLGALAFADLAERMEMAGKNKDAELIGERTGELLSALAELCRDIRAVLKKAEGNGCVRSDLSALRIEELKDALLKTNIEKVNKLLAEYLNMPLDQKTRDIVSEIEQYVLLYEYDEAVKAIDVLMRGDRAENGSAGAHGP
ncbi:MAG: response regulator [Synergistaceae bacterium]|nr:response regulator [Synergistaceae bacterium]